MSKVPGRVSKNRKIRMTPEVHETFVGLIKAGNFIETAAAAVGVDRSTVREWLKAGARDAKAHRNTKFARFRAEVLKAHAEAEGGLVTLIRTAATKENHWTAAAWLLERKFPDKWGKQLKIDTSPTVPKNLLDERTPEELDFYAKHGYFKDDAPEGAETGSQGAQEGKDAGS